MRPFPEIRSPAPRRALLAAACLGLALAACRDRQTTTAPASDAADRTPAGEVLSPWKPIFNGLETRQVSTDLPRLMQIHAVRVDLQVPGIDLLVTPSNGEAPEDAAARTTSEFLAEFKCQAAINGSAFSPLATRPAQPQDVIGLSLSRGEQYSPPNKYDALLVTQDLEARIARPPIDPGNAHNGLSGFYALLIDGKNNGTDKNIHPRSAVGISEDGRYLILMVIDGRQLGYSEGATTAETAEWMRKLGAHNALNLDGGGSTTLVIQGPDGKPLLLNRPSGVYERRVANHLGVFAQPLSPSN